MDTNIAREMRSAQRRVYRTVLQQISPFRSTLEETLLRKIQVNWPYNQATST